MTNGSAESAMRARRRGRSAGTPDRPLGKRRIPRSIAFAALAAALIAASPALGAGAKPARPDGRGTVQGPRELPEGASEADVRRHCTRKYDDEASMFNDPTASGWGGISDAQLLVKFRRCLLRHGVRP